MEDSKQKSKVHKDDKFINFTPSISSFNFFPKVAGIYLTRRCNSACSYCSVKLKRIDNELTIDKWISAIDILNQIGITRLAILGGEPTLVNGVDRIVNHLANKTNIEFSLVTNCLVKKEKILALVNNGLQRISSSLDTIDNSFYKELTFRKSANALRTLIELKKIGVEHLTAYFMLNKSNVKNVIDVAKVISDQGIWFYLLPYHHGEGSIHWETRDQTTNSDFAFNDNDTRLLEDISSQLKAMKMSGFLIANSVSYLEAFPKYAVNLNWHCGPLASELRIDADGSLMCCHDLAGELSPEFSVFDIENIEKYLEFLIVRSIDSSFCPGCIWPSQYHALESMQNLTPIEGSLR